MRASNKVVAVCQDRRRGCEILTLWYVFRDLKRDYWVITRDTYGETGKLSGTRNQRSGSHALASSGLPELFSLCLRYSMFSLVSYVHQMETTKPLPRKSRIPTTILNNRTNALEIIVFHGILIPQHSSPCSLRSHRACIQTSRIPEKYRGTFPRPAI